VSRAELIFMLIKMVNSPTFPSTKMPGCVFIWLSSAPHGPNLKDIWCGMIKRQKLPEIIPMGLSFRLTRLNFLEWWAALIWKTLLFIALEELIWKCLLATTFSIGTENRFLLLLIFVLTQARWLALCLMLTLKLITLISVEYKLHIQGRRFQFRRPAET